jgi:hypothetical protein
MNGLLAAGVLVLSDVAILGTPTLVLLNATLAAVVLVMICAVRVDPAIAMQSE